MTARPEVSEDSKKSPRARKSLRVLAKLRRLAGFRLGRRKITGVPEIGPKTEFLSLQNNTVSERKFDQRSRSSKNHFANFIFLIRMTTLNLNARAFQPGPVQRVAVSPTRVTFQIKVAQNASPAGQPQQLANEEK